MEEIRSELLNGIARVQSTGRSYSLFDIVFEWNETGMKPNFTLGEYATELKRMRDEGLVTSTKVIYHPFKDEEGEIIKHVSYNTEMFELTSEGHEALAGARA